VIIDTSAVVAMVRGQADAERLRVAVRSTASKSMSAANYLEAAIVVDSRRDPVASRELDDALDRYDIAVVSVTEAHARIAREAYRDFGKGSGHPAQLNLGDCFAYALARDTGEALLYKGADFRHTGIRSALPD
jgi:ribonuclease VapC